MLSQCREYGFSLMILLPLAVTAAFKPALSVRPNLLTLFLHKLPILIIFRLRFLLWLAVDPDDDNSLNAILCQQARPLPLNSTVIQPVFARVYTGDF